MLSFGGGNTDTAHTIASYKSTRATLSLFTVVGVCAVGCINGFFSILCMNSLFSILSVNSFASVLSVNSALAIGCTNGFLEICLNAQGNETAS